MNALFFIQGESFDIRDYPLFLEKDISENTLGMLLRRKILGILDKKYYWRIVGFLTVCDVPIVVMPKTISLPESDASRKKLALLMLQVLDKYRSLYKLQEEEYEFLLGNLTSSDSNAITAISIIEDYKSNGLLVRYKTEIQQSGDGFVDWEKTVNIQHPISSNHGIYYQAPYLRVKVMDPESDIRKIHAFVLHDCIRKWGWLIDFTEDEFEDIVLDFTLDEALNIIESESRDTYNQREIMLLASLYNYISCKKGTSIIHTGEMICTPFFHRVWEKICCYIIGDQYSKLQAFIPELKWNGEFQDKTVKEIPDALIVDNNDFYIIDAKYYDDQTSIPGWHDIVKQYFYQLSIQGYIDKYCNSCISLDVNSDSKVIDKYHNLFILPGESEGGSVIRYSSSISVPVIDSLVTLEAYKLDVISAMKYFVEGDFGCFRNTLIRTVSNIVHY